MPPRRSASTASTKNKSTAVRPRGRPSAKGKAKKSNEFIDDEAEETIEISSDDDAKSVKSSKVTQSDDEENVTVPITPTRNGRSVKRRASALTPPVSDDEDADSHASPKKQRLTPVQKGRFQGSAKKVAPIKNLVTEDSSKGKSPRARKPVFNSGDKDDVFVDQAKTNVDLTSDVEELEDVSTDISGKTTSKSKYRLVPEVVIPIKRKVLGKEDSSLDSDKQIVKEISAKGSKPSKSIHYDSDEGERLSGFEVDSEEEAAYLTDQITSLSSPENDESDVGTRDKALLASYKGLDNIRFACMLSWSDLHGDGHPTYSGVKSLLSNLNRRLYKDAILFEQNGNIGNISRTSPSLVSTGDGGKPYFHMLGAGAKAMMFTSVVLVKQSFLEEPKISGNGKLFKVIDGALLAGEYERFVGAVGMIIREQEFKSQLYLDNLSFTTAFASSDNKAGGSSSPSKPSPFTRTAGSSSFQKTTLACHDIIPVWNAVGDKTFGFNDMIPKLLFDPKLLPRQRGEIPSGSCAVVGYTVNTFKKPNDTLKSVSFNVQFAIVLGTPSD